MRVAHLLFVLCLCCWQLCTGEMADVQGIQIITPKDHVFNLELNELQQIVQRDDLKDRNVVIVSIAGAYRQGKSFLLNFFIKYLQAQYKKHDVSDWLGENEDDKQLRGFTWRSGRKRQTTGIWMWSEIFTHDFPNGEKVAIILLDTQGIFDDKSSVRDCTTIFALSMMLSSVQCYNVMQNIKEDDLQHLEMFTEYGRLALQQSEIKPFQKLLFIVRDWPYGFETNYGSHGQQVIDEILAGNDEQTYEMKQLRRRIDSSFSEIGAFLMPYPGAAVAQGNRFTGDLKQIDREFIKYIKELAPSLFAPRNLAVKKINGQNVRVRDLIPYLEAYTRIFNSDLLPEPKTIFMATAETSNMILMNDCVDLYVSAMQNATNTDESFFNENQLGKIHQQAKNQAITMFENKPKLGGDRFAASTQRKIEEEIEKKFVSFNQTNEDNRKHFMEKANLHNTNLGNTVRVSFGNNILGEIEKMPTELRLSDLNNLFVTSKGSALQEFNAMKMGDETISKTSHDKLERDLDDFQSALIKLAELYDECLQIYTRSMQSSLDRTDAFLEQSEIIKSHQDAKTATLNKFIEKPKAGGNELAYKIQVKLEHFTEAKYQHFDGENNRKRDSFTAKANTHNENLIKELKTGLENKMLREIGNTYLNDAAFIGSFIRLKTAALEEFGTRKMGASAISNAFRERLERDADSLQPSLKQSNDRNKPKDVQYVYVQGGKQNKGDGGLTMVGAGIGAAVGGGPGAVVGGFVGKTFGKLFG